MCKAHPRTDPVVTFVLVRLEATLGSLAFPMFIVHGPIGQIFYKKANELEQRTGKFLVASCY